MNLQEQIDQYLTEVNSFTPENADQAEQFRLRFLSRKGILAELFEVFKTVPNDQKRVLGAELNKLKQAVETRLEGVQTKKQGPAAVSLSDLTRPAGQIELGTRHPLSIVRKEILDIFQRIGFTVADGPEIEDDWHVFSGLNFPPEHPARDMQDTFFIEKSEEREMVLRTHTSSVQVRAKIGRAHV